ncbi:MAG: hypothetical protein WBH50_19460 [Fuerstiella sp.]
MGNGNCTSLILKLIDDEVENSEEPHYHVYARMGISAQHHSKWRIGKSRPGADSIDKLMGYFGLEISQANAKPESEVR